MPTVFILSWPSGVGKTTLWEAIKLEADSLKIEKVITTTTRNPRPWEINWKDYWFVSVEEFEKMIEEWRMIEWAQVHGNFYGSTYNELERIIKKWNRPLYIVDPQWVISLKKTLSSSNFLKSSYNVSFQIKTIFVVPPSEEELKRRLLKRWEDPNSESFRIRLQESLNWLKMKDIFDYVIVNDNLEKAVEEFKNILME